MNIIFVNSLLKDLKGAVERKEYSPKTYEHLELMVFCLDKAEKIEYNSLFSFINNHRKNKFNFWINKFSGLYCKNDDDYNYLKNIIRKNSMENV